MDVTEIGNAHTAVTTSVCAIRSSSSIRRPFPVSASSTANAGTIVAHPPMLNASTNDSELTARHATCAPRAHARSSVTASPSDSSTPIPMHPANTLGLMNTDVIRTPSSTAASCV